MIAIVFIGAAIILCFASFPCYVKVASVFATLAGAVLVFSTLEMQRQSLEEEKRRNRNFRFDLRFYPILSSFRTDATKIEISRDYLVQRGVGLGHEKQITYIGEKAFYVGIDIIETLLKGIRDKSFVDYSQEEIAVQLSEINRKAESIDEAIAISEDFESLDKERHNVVSSQQIPFLLFNYGISREVKERLSNIDQDKICSFLFDKLLEKQPSTFIKYVRTLRFLMRIIEENVSPTERGEYYLNICCQLEENELMFLRHFKEFKDITNVAITPDNQDDRITNNN